MTEHLVVKCKACGKEFPAGIQMDRGSFESSTLSGNSYKCPTCGVQKVYEKADHRFAT